MQGRIEWITGVIVAAGLGFFLLSVLSSRDVTEEDGLPERVAGVGGERPRIGSVLDRQHRETGFAGEGEPPRFLDGKRSQQRVAASRSRRIPPRGGTGDKEPRSSAGSPANGQIESEPGRLRSVTGGRDVGSGRSGRRGELVEFLANKRPSLEDAMSGKGAVEDAEVSEQDGEAVEDDVLLSVPLVEGTEAEGYTQPILDEGVEVDADGSVEFPEDSVLAFPDAGNARGDSGTIALEIEPNWNGSDPGDNSFVQVRELDAWQGKVSLFRNGAGLRFVIIDAEGREYGATAPIADWQQGDRHSVTATWDSNDGILSLYVDGVVAEQTSYSGNLDIPPGTPMFLGSNPRHHVPGAGATLQNFKVYGRALSPDEVSGGVAPSANTDPG